MRTLAILFFICCLWYNRCSMSADIFHELTKQMSSGVNPLDIVGGNQELMSFLGNLVQLQLDYFGRFPLTIRHIAAFMPRGAEETTEICQARVYKSVALLRTAGVLKPCDGPNSRIQDGADWLPTYEFVPGVVGQYLELH